jgi:hypothetical protein
MLRRYKMSSNKSGLRNAGSKPNAELGDALLSILAVGVVGGAALIGAAKKLGDHIVNKQAEDQDRKEAERDAQKEAVRQAAANDYDQ